MNNYPKNRYLLHWAAASISLFVFVVLVLFIGLPSVGGSSEAREAHIVQSIAQTGDWILPRRNGIVPSKPPLFHWIGALLTYSWGSFHPFTPRMVSAFFACGIIYLTIVLAGRFALLFPETFGKLALRLGIGAGFILSTTYGFLRLAGDARVDMTFSFFVVLAIFSVLRPFSTSGIETAFPLALKDWYLFYCACALACLSKGPLGLVLPLLIIGSCFSYLAGIKQAGRELLRPRSSWILFFLIVLPWYFSAAYQGQGDFLERQLLFENVRRFFGGEHVNSRPFWFYLFSFTVKACPWSLLFCGFLLRAVLKKRELGKSIFESDRRERMLNVFVVWFFTGLFFLSLSSGKRHSYLLPLLPGVSIYLSFCICQLIRRLSEKDKIFGGTVLRRSSGYMLVAVFFLLCFSSLVRLPFPNLSTLHYEGMAWLVDNSSVLQTGIVLFLLVYCCLLRIKRDKIEYHALALWGSSLFLLVAFVQLGLGIKNNFKSYDRIAERVKSVTGVASEVQVLRSRYDESLDPILFYLDREVSIVEPDFPSISCHKQFLLANRRDFKSFQGYAKSRGIRLDLHGSFRQTADNLRERSDRDVILFTCRGLEPA